MCDTIAAIATAPGLGGIAILRVSGPDAERILKTVFRRADGKKEWVSHQMVYGKIIDYDGRILDESMAVLMKAPRSYTREDVAELHCHGGDTVCRQVLEAVLALGVRPAGPGEFTRRAFENGRIDLSQAEAAMRLIGAQGEAEAREALRQMDGAVYRMIHGTMDEITGMLSKIAACTDFPDEIEEAPTAEQLTVQAKLLISKLMKACDPQRGRVLENGFQVVIAGKPNVGKSSLLNALTGEEHAIVTAQEGTTRDMVRVPLLIDGVRVELTDTAGLRQTENEAEALGVERARKAIAQADLLLIVLDGTRKLSTEDERLLSETKTVRRMVLCNKSDLREKASFPYDMEISARTGEGLDVLKDHLREAVAQSMHSGGGLLTQARHIDAAKRAVESLSEMIQTLENGMPLDFAAVDATAALRILGEITGENAQKRVVDEVFRAFCVGK